MCFTGDPYATAIFISYSHGDSGDGGPETYYKRWSRHFWRALDRQLRSYPDLAGITTHFGDNKRQGGGLALFESIDPALKESVSRSAILLALMSQQYTGSTEAFALACERLGGDTDLAEIERQYGLAELTAICGDNPPLPVEPAKLQ